MKTAKQILLEAADLLDWKPIESAPTDGSKFDVWCVHPDPIKWSMTGIRFTDVQMRGDNSGFGFVYHTKDGAQWQYLDDRHNSGIWPEWVPTHWMAIPDGPVRQAS